MAPHTTTLQKVTALLDELSATELETVQLLAKGKIEEHEDGIKPCGFLALSAELRNQIYTLVAIDQIFKVAVPVGPEQENGLAVANKQISAEYLSILNSKEMVRAKYLEDVYPMRWAEVDVRKLLTAWTFYERRLPSAEGLIICNLYDDYADAEEAVIKKMESDEGPCPQYGDLSESWYWGILELAGSDEGCWVFKTRVSDVDYYT